jgi:hypothetical protein
VELKNIPDPGYSDDDGTADPRLAEALAAWAGDRTADGPVLAALAGARLLVPVVAVLGETETDERGLKREKTSEMAVPVLTAGDRRALPAFTSMETMHRWDPSARPVAVPVGQALHALAHEKADTLVLDVAGPVPYQLAGPALIAVAEGRASADPLDDPAVTAALREVLDTEPAVRSARLLPADGADAVLAVETASGTGPEAAAEAVRRIAGAIAGHDTLRARLVRGLDLALLPAGTAAPGEPFFVR